MKAVSVWMLAVFATSAYAPITQARPAHRHHLVTPASGSPGRSSIPNAYSYYPHEIDGGVSGNLPFNNQIRKHVDPLNANGGGG